MSYVGARLVFTREKSNSVIVNVRRPLRILLQGPPKIGIGGNVPRLRVRKDRGRLRLRTCWARRSFSRLNHGSVGGSAARSVMQSLGRIGGYMGPPLLSRTIIQPRNKMLAVKLQDGFSQTFLRSVNSYRKPWLECKSTREIEDIDVTVTITRGARPADDDKPH